jgi:hypothetical protein
MTENKGLHLEDMMREFVLPHIKKQLNNKDELVAMLADYNITRLDSMFVPKEAVRRYNQKVVKDLIAGKIPDPYDQNQAEGQVQGELNQTGNTRFIDPENVSWKDVFKDLVWDLEVQITNEQSDKQTVLTTLNTLLQTIMAKQGMPFTPQETLVVNKILQQTGIISPLEFSQVQSASQQQQMQAPQPGQPVQPGQPGQPQFGQPQPAPQPQPGQPQPTPPIAAPAPA